MRETCEVELVAEVRADARGRVAIAHAGAVAGRRYQVYSDRAGRVVLEPVVSVPESKAKPFTAPAIPAQAKPKARAGARAGAGARGHA